MTVSIEHQADLADGYERESVYVEMQDGCRIAVDVLHPAQGGRRLDGYRTRGWCSSIRPPSPTMALHFIPRVKPTCWTSYPANE